jgi:hypothetical protein
MLCSFVELLRMKNQLGVPVFTILRVKLGAKRLCVLHAFVSGGKNFSN